MITFSGVRLGDFRVSNYKNQSSSDVILVRFGLEIRIIC
jgi:hypothetical protein